MRLPVTKDFEKAIKIKPTFVEAIRNRDIAKDMGRHYQEKKETGSQISPAEIAKQIEARDKARQCFCFNQLKKLASGR